MAHDSRPALHGFVPAAVTPFTPRGEPMLDAFAEVVRWLMDQGASGICVAGDNGEAWTLTHDERRTLTEMAIREVAGRGPVILGISAVSARQTIAYAEVAATSGADAVLLLPQPYVMKATRAEIVGRFETIAQAVPIPVVAYNSPRRTGLNMDPDTLDAICDVAPVIGLKEASRDFFHTTRILERFAGRIAVMMGPAPFIFPGLALGARGFISSGPELLGPRLKRIMPLAAERPCAEAHRLHFALTRVYETLMDSGTWPASLKAALALRGVPTGDPREPVAPLTAEARDRVRAMLADVDSLLSDRAAVVS